MFLYQHVSIIRGVFISRSLLYWMSIIGVSIKWGVYNIFIEGFYYRVDYYRGSLLQGVYNILGLLKG